MAVLNDCKYEYDVLGGRVRITLIKSATSPDPLADQGHHEFTYALLPYAAADQHILDHEAYDLNAPLRVLPAVRAPSRPSFPHIQTNCKNVILETVKPANDGNGIIVRLFEAHGKATTTQLEFGVGVTSCEIVTIFETPDRSIEADGPMIDLTFTPFQIMTVRVVLDDN